MKKFMKSIRSSDKLARPSKSSIRKSESFDVLQTVSSTSPSAVNGSNALLPPNQLSLRSPSPTPSSYLNSTSPSSSYTSSFLDSVSPSPSASQLTTSASSSPTSPVSPISNSFPTLQIIVSQEDSFSTAPAQKEKPQEDDEPISPRKKGHVRNRSVSSPPQMMQAAVNLKNAASAESIFHKIGTNDEGIEELEPDEEGELGDNIWDEKGSVIFVDNEGKRVRAGNINQLMLHFTEASNVSNAGAEFTETFMITLQTFVTPYQFLRKLTERYRVPPCPGGQNPEVYDKDIRVPVQLRVVKILKKWVASRYDQDFAHNPNLLEELSLFAENVVTQDHPSAAKNLLDAIRSVADIHFSSLSLAAKNFHRSADSVNTSRDSIHSKNEDLYSTLPSLITVDYKQLGAQMTLLDAQFFKAIRLTEFVGQAWNGKKKKAPHIIKFIAHTNRITNWIISEILSFESPKQRAKVFANFICILSVLKIYRNYAGIMAVISALHSAPISRLKLTKKEMNSKALKTVDVFMELMSSESSFKRYREDLKSSNEPCVPFIGVTLSDLTFLEDGNPDFILGSLINWQKRTLVSRGLIEFTELQRLCKYTIEETPMLQGFQRRVKDGQQTAEELYRLSLKLEPRQADVKEKK